MIRRYVLYVGTTIAQHERLCCKYFIAAGEKTETRQVSYTSRPEKWHAWVVGKAGGEVGPFSTALRWLYHMFGDGR